MTTARELRSATTRELRDHIVRGHPVDPRAIEGFAYRGTSLGLPRVVERLTWKTFQKTFYRDPSSGRLFGWNVRLEQDGIDAPSRPKKRRGVPVTEWHYEVTGAAGVPAPKGFDRGLIIDYSRAPNPPGPMTITKDPLVALSPGDPTELLGVSYLVVGGRCVETPTYFTLEREAPIEHVPYDDPRPTFEWLRLSAFERRWASALFGAIIGAGGGDGLPPFASVDEGLFYRRFESAAAPLVRAGLRPMLYALVLAPVTMGYKKPFFALSTEDQARFLIEVDHEGNAFLRQSLAALKTLACFAYFEDPVVRARVGGSV